MKFYSEELKTLFDTPEQVEEAEKAAAAKKANEEAKRKQEQENTAKLKKELASAVDQCDAELKAAYDNLTVVKKECKELADAVNADIRDQIKAATDRVAAAQKARANAISQFNKKFGPFQKNYTGQKAVEELNMMTALFDDIFNFNW